ncbi:SDR family NAD(P)-dependent oxidoreductase [Umezawaea endophytica]|uniref:SDR family NAD(P)-dependent oxidoreductase n=1 Tax=Umezawaea endophytica TaxID=1654476 RepID=A0A9X3AIF0_9PSEU|nr:SDR family NAD(P)-dependent oxidoreductase [Umezawaea endophytica]MCS7483032.1 SDR family NAD(P)-dependent oxidoreductase [Umezawaea endophytica]
MTRTAVITGAAGGLGTAVARQLLGAGVRVVVLTRDAASARTATEGLRRVPGGELLAGSHHGSLLVRDDVRALAEELAARGEPVDVLVNNAGAAFPGYAETPDGAERTHAVNHHAPFLLTHLLLSQGVLAPGARIVNVSSDLEKRGRLDREHLDVLGTSWRDRFGQMPVYGTAKLLNVLATAELARRLPEGMSAYSASPGVVRTGFTSNAGGGMKAFGKLAGLFSSTPDEGARTPVHLAVSTSPPRPNGGYFAKAAPATPSEQARDAVLAAKVYRRTAEEVGVAPLGS